MIVAVSRARMKHMPNCARQGMAVTGLACLFACASPSGERSTADEDRSAAAGKGSTPPQPLGPTCEGHFDPHQQSDLDALAGCVEIIGTLIVETFEGADLEPLANLEVVSDALIIGSNAMAGFESLEGLRSLRSVGWFLHLDNTLAPDLSGLRS